MTLGTHIAALRAAQGLSQAELAERLRVSRQSVSKWETDASVPELDKLMGLSEVFGVTLDELVKYDGLDLPTETAPEPATATPKQPPRVLVGSALLLFGALLALVFSLRGNPLTVVSFIALPFLGCALVCLLAKKNIPLWCAWFVFWAVQFFEDFVPPYYWPLYRPALWYFAPWVLVPLTAWCLRRGLWAAPKRRKLVVGLWLCGAAAYWPLRWGYWEQSTVLTWLSYTENLLRYHVALAMWRLSTALVYALITVALAALFYCGEGLLRKRRAHSA